MSPNFYPFKIVLGECYLRFVYWLHFFNGPVQNFHQLSWNLFCGDLHSEPAPASAHHPPDAHYYSVVDEPQLS